MTFAPEEIKSCCAAAYSSAAARLLLGDSFHPGGAQLTSRLVRALGVGPGSVVVDVASGLGTSALQLARETGCEVVGVELARENVEAARAAAEREGLAGRVRFVLGDAERLPIADRSVDGALCECALCTFPDKAAAAAELTRVLRPGARLGLSDVTADRERLPAELSTLDAWIACLGDALPLQAIADLLGRAGLAVEAAERHDEALATLVEQVEGRLRAARALLSVDLEPWLALAGAAREAVATGALGYGVVVARKL